MATQADPNALLRRAEEAFRAGRFDAARADLVAIDRVAGEQPVALHLLGLVERRRGDFGAARLAFERALSLAPSDAQIWGNYANLLDAVGEVESALDAYGRALALKPDFPDARLNRALVLQRAGRLQEAAGELQAVAAAAPRNAKALTAYGTVLRLLDRLEEAATAFDAALGLDPARTTALHGRARVAMERGENAVDLYRRAAATKPGDRELMLGLAEALEAEGDPGAEAAMRGVVAAHPDWPVGYEQLARLRSEAGEAGDFADAYLPALEARPRDRTLHYSYWQSLVRGERYADALAALDAARPGLGEDRDMLVMEAVFASELGERERADRAFARLPATPDVDLARARHALRGGDPARAARLLEPLTEAAPADVTVWAHLSLAWRLLEDPRQHWLCERPGLVGAIDLGLSGDELTALTERLRGLHRAKAHPIGQSLRGGTQTRGRLFRRGEPEIVRLRERIAEAVAAHVAAWPPRDDAHPLLRHAGRAFAFDGSWSVRLLGAGFHVAHIHPRGVLSSACYVALPEGVGGADRAGWLELGRPPVEFGLELEPLQVIEPRPGRLALFPSYLFHGTRPFQAGERLTVAFDAVPA